MKTCWVESEHAPGPHGDNCDTCSNPMLDGLLTCGGGGKKAEGGGGGVYSPQPRSSWWALKKHGCATILPSHCLSWCSSAFLCGSTVVTEDRYRSDMSGRYVLPVGVHNPQQEYDGIASVDCAAGRMMVLVGFFPFGSLPADHPAVSPTPLGPANNITLSLANVPRCLASSSQGSGQDRLARLLVEYIPSSNYDASPPPTVLKDELVRLPPPPPTTGSGSGTAGAPLELVVEMAPLSVIAVTIS